MAITEKELLLLSNLMYNDGELTEGDTVANVIKAIKRTDNYNNQMSPAQRQIIDAIESDPKLTELYIAKKTPGYSDVMAACFVDPEGNATVAFKGSDGTQFVWNDNVQGENKSDTLAQRQAEGFIKDVCRDYDNITVTGHSKGGNLASYTALLCPSVSRCVGFDAQGFSDEFHQKYAKKIAENQNKITVFAAENDYVNPLLKPVGTKHYIKNDSKGAGGGGHNPETLYATNSGGDPHGDFEKSCYTNRKWYVGLEEGGVKVISGFLHILPPRTHQLIVDLSGTLLAGCTAGLVDGNYSWDEFTSDLGRAFDRFFGNNMKYFTNADYTIDLISIDNSCENTESVRSELEGYKNELQDIYNRFVATSPSLLIQKFILGKLVDEADLTQKKLLKMTSGLYGIRQLYTDTEIRAAEFAEGC